MARTPTRPKRTQSPDPTERLATYRAKRDFTTTPEPSGAAPTGVAEGVAPDPSSGRRFVVQRHRARRLHYDLRLEMGGVLVSWAVPKGPTLDPTQKRMAVHVEDHPLDYYDFEGVIPAGEYGGGDVIVWDWGTWEHARRGDPMAAVERGELHVDLHGEKLRGRFALVRRGDGRDWLLVHKRDDAAIEGWDAEDHPRSVKTGRDNDEVLADHASDVWHARRDTDPPAGATADELDALSALAGGRHPQRWTFQSRELRLTNLDKVLFPATAERPPTTKRELVRYMAVMAPAIVPYLRGRPVNTRRVPDGVGTAGFWQKAALPNSPPWVTTWHNAEADPGETETYTVVDQPATLAFLANMAVLELHPWTSTAAAPHEPTWAMIDIDPGSATTWDDTLVLARLFRTALDHLGVRAAAKVTGKRGIQVWVPVRDGLTFETTRAWVEEVSRAVGATVPELVSWNWGRDQRGGLARLDYTQNAINRTLVAPWSPREVAGAPVSVPIAWDELDDPSLRPDGWTVHTAVDRWRAQGDPLLPLVGLQQDLPGFG
jgi:bifunctional non-homologous end joining protein LigD